MPPTYRAARVARCVRRLAAPATALLLALPAAGAELALRPPDGAARPAEKIVNGLLDFGHPAVGVLLGPQGVRCSAVVVGCRTALTAASCFCTDPFTGEPLPGAECLAHPELLATAGHSLFLQHHPPVPLAEVVVHPDSELGVGRDLALLRLGASVAGIAPLPVRAGAPPVAGSAGTLVGFGRAGGESEDWGLKRAGAVALTGCQAVPAEGNLCWQFTAPLPAPGAGVNGCDRDAGGGLLLEAADGLELAGVVSGGLSADCLPPDEGWATEVATESDWIVTAAAGDPLGPEGCGDLRSAGQAGTLVQGASGDLDGTAPEARASFEIPEGSVLLRAGLNGDENGRLGEAPDADLYLRAGAPAERDAFDCRSAGSGVFEACEVSAPEAGTWHALVTREAGAGLFQLTATSFAGQPTTCTPGPNTLCLDDVAGDRRFKVEIDYFSPPRGVAGTGKAVPLASLGVSRGGLFWFFSPDNPEVLVKVLNACTPALGNRFWVFLTAGTDLGYTLTVTDTETGLFRTYANEDGASALPVQDVAAFPCP